MFADVTRENASGQVVPASRGEGTKTVNCFPSFAFAEIVGPASARAAAVATMDGDVETPMAYSLV